MEGIESRKEETFKYEGSLGSRLHKVKDLEYFAYASGHQKKFMTLLII